MELFIRKAQKNSCELLLIFVWDFNISKDCELYRCHKHVHKQMFFFCRKETKELFHYYFKDN